MTQLLDAIPMGWSLVRVDEGWQVYDHTGSLLKEPQTSVELAMFLEHEVRCAQEFAAFQWAMKGPMPAQA